jgi:hypothetical protein
MSVMKNNSLSETGLSLSQAQSISNMCNQRTREISAALQRVNNASKEFSLDGKQYVETPGNPLPSNVVELIKEKSRLHALQAFLMENIKAKDTLLRSKQNELFEYSVESPKMPTRNEFDATSLVDESFGWDQLTVAEINEFYEAESFAAHIGQFIHKGGKLDELRNNLPYIKTLDWIEIEKDKKTPVEVKIHHTSDALLALHEDLAALHRSYEQRVNYFKAKVKNIVTNENARISKENAIKQDEINKANALIAEEYHTKFKAYQAEYQKCLHEFESNRQQAIEKIAQLRIAIDTRFQSLVDELLVKIN